MLGSYYCSLLGALSPMGLKVQLSVYISMVMCGVHLVVGILPMNDQDKQEDKESENRRQVPTLY